MFIRRVRTKSGATAVQVAEYRNGRQEILTHVGSAHTVAELGLLEERARAWMADDGQAEFDLGITPTPGVTSLVPPPAGPALLTGDPQGPGRSVVRDSPGRVIGTASRLLYDALAGVYADLGFASAIRDEVFADLVIARLVEPTSLLDCGRVLTDLGKAPASYATLKRTLGRAYDGSYRAKLTSAAYAHAARHGDISLCLYDVTTLYFETEKEDSLRKVGYSKERRVDPQIVVGLLVDRTGFPLEIGCFEGNKAETLTLLPIIEAFKTRNSLEHLVVVADAGMLSGTNLKQLDEAGCGFIVGSRASKAPLDLESHFHWHGDAFDDGQIIDTVTPKHGRNTTDNDTTKRAEPVWNPDRHPGSWRAVWAFSRKRWVRDNQTVTLQENKARAVAGGEKAARRPRFVTLKGAKQTVNETAIARARAVAGLKGYVTNMPHNVMSASEVTGSYHELWHVEQSFRMSKSDLAARPMFHHKRDAIEAHLTVVVTALAVAREVQARTGLAIRNVIRTLRPLRSATIAINGTEQTFPPKPTPEQQTILDALDPGKLHALTK